jgi:hypothetical protein
MTTIVRTETGSIYESQGNQIRRVGADGMPLRRDGEWIEVVHADEPVVGERWDLWLQLLEDRNVQTYRSTSPVVSVETPSPVSEGYVCPPNCPVCAYFARMDEYVGTD